MSQFSQLDDMNEMLDSDAFNYDDFPTPTLSSTPRSYHTPEKLSHYIHHTTLLHHHMPLLFASPTFNSRLPHDWPTDFPPENPKEISLSSLTFNRLFAYFNLLLRYKQINTVNSINDSSDDDLVYSPHYNQHLSFEHISQLSAPILILQGPCGAAKSATVNYFAQQHNLEQVHFTHDTVSIHEQDSSYFSGLVNTLPFDITTEITPRTLKLALFLLSAEKSDFTSFSLTGNSKKIRGKLSSNVKVALSAPRRHPVLVVPSFSLEEEENQLKYVLQTLEYLSHPDVKLKTPIIFMITTEYEGDSPILHQFQQLGQTYSSAQALRKDEVRAASGVTWFNIRGTTDLSLDFALKLVLFRARNKMYETYIDFLRSRIAEMSKIFEQIAENDQHFNSADYRGQDIDTVLDLIENETESLRQHGEAIGPEYFFHPDPHLLIFDPPIISKFDQVIIANIISNARGDLRQAIYALQTFYTHFYDSTQWFAYIDKWITASEHSQQQQLLEKSQTFEIMNEYDDKSPENTQKEHLRGYYNAAIDHMQHITATSKDTNISIYHLVSKILHKHKQNDQFNLAQLPIVPPRLPGNPTKDKNGTEKNPYGDMILSSAHDVMGVLESTFLLSSKNSQTIIENGSNSAFIIQFDDLATSAMDDTRVIDHICHNWLSSTPNITHNPFHSQNSPLHSQNSPTSFPHSQTSLNILGSQTSTPFPQNSQHSSIHISRNSNTMFDSFDDDHNNFLSSSTTTIPSSVGINMTISPSQSKQPSSSFLSVQSPWPSSSSFLPRLQSQNSLAPTDSSYISTLLSNVFGDPDTLLSSELPENAQESTLFPTTLIPTTKAAPSISSLFSIKSTITHKSSLTKPLTYHSYSLSTLANPPNRPIPPPEPTIPSHTPPQSLFTLIAAIADGFSLSYYLYSSYIYAASCHFYESYRSIAADFGVASPITLSSPLVIAAKTYNYYSLLLYKDVKRRAQSPPLHGWSFNPNSLLLGAKSYADCLYRVQRVADDKLALFRTLSLQITILPKELDFPLIKTKNSHKKRNDIHNIINCLSLPTTFNNITTMVQFKTNKHIEIIRNRQVAKRKQALNARTPLPLSALTDVHLICPLLPPPIHTASSTPFFHAQVTSSRHPSNSEIVSPPTPLWSQFIASRSGITDFISFLPQWVQYSLLKDEFDLPTYNHIQIFSPYAGYVSAVDINPNVMNTIIEEAVYLQNQINTKQTPLNFQTQELLQVTTYLPFAFSFLSLFSTSFIFLVTSFWQLDPQIGYKMGQLLPNSNHFNNYTNHESKDSGETVLDLVKKDSSLTLAFETLIDLKRNMITPAQLEFQQIPHLAGQLRQDLQYSQTQQDNSLAPIWSVHIDDNSSTINPRDLISLYKHPILATYRAYLTALSNIIKQMDYFMQASYHTNNTTNERAYVSVIDLIRQFWVIEDAITFSFKNIFREQKDLEDAVQARSAKNMLFSADDNGAIVATAATPTNPKQNQDFEIFSRDLDQIDDDDFF